VSSTLSVRARLEPRPGPPFERLFDPLLDELIRGGPFARERFAVLWPDTAALTALAAAKRAPLPAPLAAALGDYHRRLGAPAASLAALDRLARGEAVAAVAGQQPAPLGGPLFSLHKTAAACGLAAVAAERTGMPCVPLFWMHGEDSDFAEIRGATLVDASLALHDLELPASAHVEGGLVGAIPIAALDALHAQAATLWDGHPAGGSAAALLAHARSRARDLGEMMSALMLALFGDRGLVVVDPRLPEFRAAARPILERYLRDAAGLNAAARRAGERVEAVLGRRPLDDRALDSFVFAIEDGRRRKMDPAEAAGLPASRPLSPSVALRPAVQDGVFPTIAMACGPGEAAYLAQLREVFAGLGVAPACAVPRFTATWLPPAATGLIEASGVEPWEVVVGADSVLRTIAEAQVPAEARAALARARAAATDGLAQVAEASRRVDTSLPQMVESARGKVDYQFARLEEGLVGKVRHRLERQHPEWVRLRYVLAPGDKLQERRLASLEVIAWRGSEAGGGCVDLAAEHARRLAAGHLEHWIVEL
jgi:uncharacterized protein YllA (UPF0747 family)